MALKLFQDSITPKNASLCSPIFLAGKPAVDFAMTNGFPPNVDLISPSALKQWQQAKEAVNIYEKKADYLLSPHKWPDSLDTIGGMFLSVHEAVAGCSSGGLILKDPGRIGHVHLLISVWTSFHFCILGCCNWSWLFRQENHVGLFFKSIFVSLVLFHR